MPTVRKIMTPDASSDSTSTVTAVEEATAHVPVLPSGWEWTTVGMIAQLVRGVTYDKSGVSDHYKEDYVAVLRATNIQDEDLVLDDDLVYVARKYVNPEQMLIPGDVIICTSSGSKHLVGKTGQLLREWSGSFGAFCAVARFNSRVNRNFAGYFFSSPGYREVIREKSSGVNINNLRRGDIEEITFPLPPLAEQHRIVEAIETQLTRLDAGVTTLKTAQAKLKRYRASVLKAACEGRLVPQDASDEPADALLHRILTERRARWEAEQTAKMEAQGRMILDDGWRERYKEPAPPDTSGLPELPNGWVWANAEQCTSLITDGEHATPERSEQGVLLLSARNVQDGWLSLEKVDYIPERVYEVLSKRLVIEDDDVLLSCSGSVGRSCVVPPNLKFALVRSVAVLKPLARMGRYLCLSLRSPILQFQIEDRKTQTAQANIFQGKIKTLVFPLPPLAEQHRIVAEAERRLSVAIQAEATVAANLKRAERLRQAVLKRAFTGQLVRQDPSDEPASVLLERIKASKQEAEGMKQSSSGRRGAKQLRLEGM